MKKIIISLCLLIFANIALASSGIYTNEYVKNFETCKVHIEKYDAEIPSSAPSEGSIHLKTTESILGWKDGKCLTKSVVYSKDLKQDILTSNCAFNQTQLETIAKKMQLAKSKDNKIRNKAQNEISKYINENSICVTKNLIQ